MLIHFFLGPTTPPGCSFLPQVLMSHDWPRGVTRFGNEEKLLRFKKHFREEVADDRLGSGPTREVFILYF